MAHVEIESDGNRVLVRAHDIAGADRFAEYRKACARAGGRWDGSLRANVIPVKRVGDLVSYLTELGLDCVAEEAVKAEAPKQEASADADVATARRRIQELIDRGIKPFKHQPVGIEWIAGRQRGMVNDDMGLGKTMQFLLGLPDNAAALVVCPASLKLNWRAEAKVFRPDLRVTVLAGLKSFRFPEPGELVIMNYDILPGKVEKPKTPGGRHRIVGVPTPEWPVILVSDESHALKSSKARRSRLFRKLSSNIRAAGGRTWGGTGTELVNRPVELWNVLNAFDLAIEAFGSWDRFARLMGGKRGPFGWTWSAEPNPEVITALRRVSIKRMKVDVLKDLPPKRRQTIPVEIDAKTKKMCDEVLTHLKARGIDLEDVDATVEITKLKGAGFAMLSKAMTALAIAKMGAMAELVEEYEDAGLPLVVFSAHREPINMFEAREGWGVIHGGTPVHAHKDKDVPKNCTCRQAIANRFQAGELKGIAGTIPAMGTGLNLTNASNMLMVDLDWTPALNNQAEDRINRIGQKQPTLIRIMEADHALDRRRNELLEQKRALIAATTEAAALKDGEAPAQYEPAPTDAQDAPGGEILWRTTHTGQRVKIDAPVERRAPGGALERWAGMGMLYLAAADADGATTLNMAGFSKNDTDFGHKLAERIEKHGGQLSEKEWAAAIRLARRYRRQLSPEPTTEGAI